MPGILHKQLEKVQFLKYLLYVRAKDGGESRPFLGGGGDNRPALDLYYNILYNILQVNFKSPESFILITPAKFCLSCLLVFISYIKANNMPA